MRMGMRNSPTVVQVAMYSCAPGRTPRVSAPRSSDWRARHTADPHGCER